MGSSTRQHILKSNLYSGFVEQTTQGADIWDFAYVMHGFIEQLGDLCCLVHNGYGAYEPHNKQWVKDRVFAHLKRMAQ
jgi:hypothetical protein